MPRLAELQRRVATLGELHEIVGALRSVAAGRLRQAQQAFAGIATYEETVRRAMAEALALLGGPPPERPRHPRVLIVLCSEHGFVGGFDDRLLERARTVEAAELWVVGTRGGRTARDLGLPVGRVLPMATRTEAVLGTSRDLADALFRRIGAGVLVGAALLYTRYEAPVRGELTLRTLLPPDLLDLEPVDAAPLTYLEPVALLEAIVAEHVLAGLTRAAMASFAAENDARLRTLIGAYHHLDDRVGALRRELRQLHQAEITAELLDVVGGAEALRTFTG